MTTSTLSVQSIQWGALSVDPHVSSPNYRLTKYDMSYAKSCSANLMLVSYRLTLPELHQISQKKRLNTQKINSTLKQFFDMTCI